MKAILLACAIAAIATALPTDDIVPEFVQASAEAEAEVQGHWTDCKLGQSGCGAATIYTKSRVCTTSKKACRFPSTTVSGKKIMKGKCSKWYPKNCDQWMGRFNMQAKPGMRGRSSIPFCHELDSSVGHKLCKCKGKNKTWGGKAKKCFEGPNPKETKYCWARGSKKGTCEMMKYKQGPWSASEKLMGSCNDQGYAWAGTCSYPKGVERKKPVKAKTCTCKVNKGKGYKKVTLKITAPTKKKTFSWFKKNRGVQTHSFKSIECHGCGAVVLADNDSKRHQDHHVMKCCGKKKCSFTASSNIFKDSHDLLNDVSAIVLAHPC